MKRKLLILLVLVSVIVTLSLFLQPHVSLERLIAEEMRIRAALDAQPFVGFVVGFAVYLALSLIPGTMGKAVVVGWFYGFWPAMVIVNVGLTLAAMFTFYASRFLFAADVQRRFGRVLARFNRGLRREGAYYLFAARVLHFPFSLTNYVMGVTRIRPRGFWWATQLGLLPGNVLWVLAGNQLPSLRELADEGVSSMFSLPLFAALVALAVVPLLLQLIVRRTLRRGRASAPVETSDG